MPIPALAVPAVPAHPTAEGSAATWTWQAVAPRTMRAVLVCEVLPGGRTAGDAAAAAAGGPSCCLSRCFCSERQRKAPLVFFFWKLATRLDWGGQGGNSSNGLVPRDIPSLVRCDVPLSPRFSSFSSSFVGCLDRLSPVSKSRLDDSLGK